MKRRVLVRWPERRPYRYELGLGNAATRYGELRFADALKLVEKDGSPFRCTVRVGFGRGPDVPMEWVDVEPAAWKDAIRRARAAVTTGETDFAEVVANVYHVFAPQQPGHHAHWTLATFVPEVA